MKKVLNVFILIVLWFVISSCDSRYLFNRHAPYDEYYFGESLGYAFDYEYLRVCLRPDGYCQIVGFNDKIYEQETIIIPQHINGIPVMGVGAIYKEHPFFGRDNLQNILAAGYDLFLEIKYDDSISRVICFDSHYNELFGTKSDYNYKNVYLFSNHVNVMFDFLKCFTGSVTDEEYDEYIMKKQEEMSKTESDRRDFHKILFCGEAEKIVIDLPNIKSIYDIYVLIGFKVTISGFERIFDESCINKIVISQYFLNNCLQGLEDYRQKMHEDYLERGHSVEEAEESFRRGFDDLYKIQKCRIANVEFHYNIEINGEPYCRDNQKTDTYWFDYNYDGEYIMEPPAPYIEGYEFTGWYLDSECTIAWDFNNPYVTSEDNPILYLYAGWN